MANKGRFFLIGGIILLVLLTAGIFAASKTIDRSLVTQKEEQQKKAEGSFGQISRVGGVGWEVGSLNVLVKGIEISSKDLLLTGTYFKDDGQEQKIQIFIGEILNNGSIKIITKLLDNNGNQILTSANDFSEIEMLIGGGFPAEVQFLINVQDYEKTTKETTFCRDLPDICVLAKRTLPFQAAFGGFWYKHEPLPSGIALNAIMISRL